MSTPKEKRWFASNYFVSIRRQYFDANKVARGHGQYFDDFSAARGYLVALAEKDVENARKRLASETRALTRARGLAEPDQRQGEGV